MSDQMYKRQITGAMQTEDISNEHFNLRKETNAAITKSVIYLCLERYAHKAIFVSNAIEFVLY